MLNEEWKNIQIDGFEHYQISNYGHVKVGDKKSVSGYIIKGKDVAIDKGEGNPFVRLYSLDGTHRIKRNVGKLVLNHFSDEQHWDLDYQSKAIDGDNYNLYIGNLEWKSCKEACQEIGFKSKGVKKEWFQKYHNIIISCNNIIVAYFKDTTEMLDYFNSHGFNTSYKVVSDRLRNEGRLFWVFDISMVTDDQYEDIKNRYDIQNLKMIVDLIRVDRNKNRTIKKIVPKIIYKEKIVYKPKIEYKEKIVYKPKIEYKEKIVYKDKILYKDRPEQKVKKQSTDTKTHINTKSDIGRADFKAKLLKAMNKE